VPHLLPMEPQRDAKTLSAHPAFVDPCIASSPEPPAALVWLSITPMTRRRGRRVPLLSSSLSAPLRSPFCMLQDSQRPGHGLPAPGHPSQWGRTCDDLARLLSSLRHHGRTRTSLSVRESLCHAEVME